MKPPGPVISNQLISNTFLSDNAGRYLRLSPLYSAHIYDTGYGDKEAVIRYYGDINIYLHKALSYFLEVLKQYTTPQVLREQNSFGWLTVQFNVKFGEYIYRKEADKVL